MWEHVSVFENATPHSSFSSSCSRPLIRSSLFRVWCRARLVLVGFWELNFMRSTFLFHPSRSCWAIKLKQKKLPHSSCNRCSGAIHFKGENLSSGASMLNQTNLKIEEFHYFFSLKQQLLNFLNFIQFNWHGINIHKRKVCYDDAMRVYVNRAWENESDFLIYKMTCERSSRLHYNSFFKEDRICEKLRRIEI